MNPNYEENSCNLRKSLVSSYENCYKIKADDKEKKESDRIKMVCTISVLK